MSPWHPEKEYIIQGAAPLSKFHSWALKMAPAQGHTTPTAE